MGLSEQATVWTRKEIAERILQGENLVIYRNSLLRIPHSWLQAHPGGSLAILHFVGRDATDEIDAYHAEHTLASKVKNYIVGRVELSSKGFWEPLIPPVASGWVRETGKNPRWVKEAERRTQQEDSSLLSSEILLVKAKGNPDIESAGPTLEALEPPTPVVSLQEQVDHSIAYRELHQRITDAGLYQTRYLGGYGPEIARYLAGAALSAFAYKNEWYLSSAFFMGLVWHQLTFTVHDLGHMGVTHDWSTDRVIAIFLAGFCGGLSIGWWVSGKHSTVAK